MANGKIYAVKKGRKTGIFYTWKECKEQIEKYPGAQFKSFQVLKEAQRYLSSEAEERKGRSYYAVRKGHVPGVYDSWEKCKKQIDGFHNSEYRKFPDKETAEKWFNHNTSNASGKTCRAYVYGSFNEKTGTYGYGMILVFGKTEYSFCGSGKNPDMMNMQNAAGELEGAMRAVREALVLGYSEMTLYYHYQGVQDWVTGNWRATKAGTMHYKKFMNEKGKEIKIHFANAKTHGGIKYHKLTEELAKKAVGKL